MSPSYPKLHVVLAHAGIASRRKAEVLIIEGKIKVNGVIVKNVAARVNPQTDRIEVSGKLISAQEQFVYYLVNKPQGYVSAASDATYKTVTSLVPKIGRVYPVGRLDIDSEGLVLLTNDGDLAYALTHPKFEIPKTYHVLVKGSPSNTALGMLHSGIPLKDGKTAPAKVSVVKHEGGNTWIAITIHEGRNRQIRRMCAHLNLEVLRLIRQSIGNLFLSDLPIGKYRTLSSEEITMLKESFDQELH